MKMRPRFWFFCLMLVFLNGLWGNASEGAPVNKKQRRSDWSALRKRVERQQAVFKGTAGIVIKDLSSDRSIGINEACTLPAASLIKIPVMAACYKAIEEGRIKRSAPVRLSARDKTPGSGVLKTRPSGSVYTIEELIELMIAESDNTATNLLIEQLTPEYLNAFFKQQGLRSTCLRRKMMDFRLRRQGLENYTSARDIALMLERMYRGSCVNARVSEKCLAILLRQKMRDRIPKKLPKGTPVAHKTGLERNVCHDAGIIYAPSGDFLVCVLTKSRSKGGYAAMKDFIAKIALTVYNAYTPAKSRKN